MEKIIPQNCSMADMVIALKILEDNTLAMMNYDKKWPIMDIAALHIVEVLHITVMSNVMGLKSPFPLFPIINKASKGYFGWEGSKGFVAAAEKSRQLKSMQPKAGAISADAVAMVQLEIQACASDSTIFDTVITTVESTLQANKIISCNHCTQDLSLSSFSSSSSYSVSLSCTECSS
jgi:hypothetical protein